MREAEFLEQTPQPRPRQEDLRLCSADRLRGSFITLCNGGWNLGDPGLRRPRSEYGYGKRGRQPRRDPIQEGPLLQRHRLALGIDDLDGQGLPARTLSE